MSSASAVAPASVRGSNRAFVAAHPTAPSVIYLGMDVHKDSITIAVLRTRTALPSRGAHDGMHPHRGRGARA